MKTVTLYTDGACSGNPGPGGWGAILEWNGIEKELSGGAPQTTNNRMELTAVISGSSTTGDDTSANVFKGVYTDEANLSGFVSTLNEKKNL